MSAIVQAWGDINSSATGTSLNSSVIVTPGNTLVAALILNGAGVGSSQTPSNQAASTWTTQCGNVLTYLDSYVAADGSTVGVYGGAVVYAGIESLLSNLTGLGATNHSIILIELSGLSNSSLLTAATAHFHDTGFTQTHTGGSVTPSVAGGVVVAFQGSFATTASADFNTPAFTIPSGGQTFSGSIDAAACVQALANAPASSQTASIDTTSFANINQIVLALNPVGGDTLTPADGTYALIGGNVSFSLSTNPPNLLAAAGVYNVLGAPASSDLDITAAVGSYVLTGKAVTMVDFIAYSLTAAHGSYSLTGEPAGLPDGPVLVAIGGSYALTGEAATLTAPTAYQLSASGGSYSLAGEAAALAKGVNALLTAAAGSYSLTGEAVTLIEFGNVVLIAAVGKYAITGGIATTLIPSAAGPKLLAPPPDTAGKVIDAQIAVLQALVNANKNPVVLAQLQMELNQAQVQAVNHYMVTGWANAASLLEVYQPSAADSVGQMLASRVAFLQALYNNAPAMPPGNIAGYGDAGWTTIAANFAQQLYAAQITLMQHLMDVSNPTAATIIANTTGVQTAPAGIPYAYVFSSVGFTDAATDD